MKQHGLKRILAFVLIVAMAIPTFSFSAFATENEPEMEWVVVAEEDFADGQIGSLNAEIINNLMVNIIENSYGKPYIKLDEEHFQALQDSKRDNYARIYSGAPAFSKLDTVVKPMMAEIYGQMLDDLKAQNTDSPIFTHHIDYVNQSRYQRSQPYAHTEPNQLVVDYIASMTDDYFIELHHYLFPDSPLRVEYRGYFDKK